MALLPTCLALVPCASIESDRSNRRLDILGAFHSFTVTELPSRVAPFLIWTQVTDCHGPVRLQLKLERVPSESPEVELIWHAGRTLDHGDPRAIHDYRVPVPPFELKDGGEYRIVLLVNGKELVHRYFVAELGM